MPVMLSYKFLQQDLATTCITWSRQSLLCCPKSYPPFLFMPNAFFCVKKNFWYVVESCVRIVKVAEIEMPH